MLSLHHAVSRVFLFENVVLLAPHGRPDEVWPERGHLPAVPDLAEQGLPLLDGLEGRAAALGEAEHDAVHGDQAGMAALKRC